jgi:4-hydroxymandelate oxidase
LVVTVDAPVASLRTYGFTPDVEPAHPYDRGALPYPVVTWSMVEALANRTSLPILLKGLLSADDARRARDVGAVGVVVSNHGARQLGSVVPTAWALPRIRQAVGDDLLVLVDGGIRTGRDVLKALCLVADGALVGRPYLWALALEGEQGVSQLIARLRFELGNAMALVGCASLADCRSELVTQLGNGPDPQ